MPGPNLKRLRTVSEEKWLSALRSDEHVLRTHPHYYGYQLMPRGLHAEWRTIEDHLVSLIVRGKGVLRTSEATVNLKPGDYLWVSPRVGHELAFHPGLVRYTLRFRLLLKGRDLRTPSDCLCGSGAWGLQSWLEQIALELQTRRPYGPERLSLLVGLLSTEAFRLQRAVEGSEAGLSSVQCARISAYVSDRIFDRPTPAELAAVVRLTPDYFSRVFRKTFGQSPRTWLMRERIRYAASQLVDTSLSIKELAYKLGYGDAYLFSRQFKTVMGTSPKFFRRDIAAR